MSATSSTSAANRIRNDVSAMEIASDRFIPPTSYYVIKCSSESKDLRGIAERVVTERNDVDAPLVVFVVPHAVYFLFSSVDDEATHYLNGSHHALCSEYTSIFAYETELPVRTNIIEIETKTKVVAFFQTKIVDAAIRTAIAHSKNKLSQKTAFEWTLDELASFAPKTSPEKRFGVFIKPSGEKMSEMFDMRDIERYIRFLFGRGTSG